MAKRKSGSSRYDVSTWTRCGNKKTGYRSKTTQLCIDCCVVTECVHGTSLMEDQCKAGVVYAIQFGTEPGMSWRVPCRYIAGAEPIPCPHMQLVTREQCEAEDAESERISVTMDKLLPILIKFKADSKGQSARTTVPCPMCASDMKLTHSGYNGHVSGICATENCLRFIE